MANLLTRRACSVFSRHLSTRPVLPSRSIHLSPIVHKKKSKAVIEDDLFSDDLFVEEDLIKDTTISTEADKTSPQTNAQDVEGKRTPPTTSKTPNKTRLTPEARKARFESHIQYLEPRLGRNPTVENPRVRKRSLITLVQLANSEEELKRVVELLPKYKAANLEFTPDFAETFARRCDEVKCPLLALEVFGNFAKYSTHLTLGAGRSLIHSLSAKYPHQLAVALGLFNIYQLPPISEDLVTASMVAAAYTQQRVKTPGMKDIAEKLRDPIAQMLKTKPSNFDAPPDQIAKRMNNWIRMSLDKANRAQTARGGEAFVDPSLIPSAKKIEPTAHS